MKTLPSIIAIGLVGCLLLLPPVDAGAAQGAPSDPDDWARLGNLKARQKIEVSLTNLAKHKGKFLAWTEETITLRVKKRELTIPRAEVHRIWVFGGRKIRWGAGIGFLVGIAASPIIGQIDDQPPLGSHVFSSLLTGGAGAAIGASAGLGWRRRILFYERAGGPGSPQAAHPAEFSIDHALTAEVPRPASGNLALHLSKTLRPLTNGRAMEIMAATRPTELPSTSEDESLTARRRLYLAAPTDQ